ncbi:hypothetical protein QBC46DRAFT_384493 [Diplogelasinospora grovesii]|uniref:Uncharacterized protein n=1 Tax=Diplogelasinospora grovesii TaxID=303347 RepID=A0AAN6NAI6_9PEZI|nr:hypothetical protein QBC46DRAFT_384493 [Diplogelasinospora grovesii]
MDQTPPSTADGPSDAGLARQSAPAPARKRSISSGTGGLLSKIPFMRSSAGDSHHRPRSRENDPPSSAPLPTPSFHLSTQNDPRYNPPPLSPAMLQQQTQQQQKTRRRRGSLRKVALLGRGAQRERRESRGSLVLDTKAVDNPNNVPNNTMPLVSSPSPLGELDTNIQSLRMTGGDAFSGLGISDITPRPSMDGYASRSVASPATTTTTTTPSSDPVRSPSVTYSTTDDEDALHMSSPPSSTLNLLRPAERTSLTSLSSTSSSSSYFPPLHPPQPPLGSGSGSSATTTHRPSSTLTSSPTVPIASSIQRRRSATIQRERAKSPLALSSLVSTASPHAVSDEYEWDYAETEWWGWVVLIVTWIVFVTGMGSCLGVWSWAWDVGTTPYAPPELEDDPTLPIVGYYPALMILTAIMAWVWVIAAWVGMKYFKHARVSGD